jgi:glycosyltransferase involved in cell wall biosynthesis
VTDLSSLRIAIVHEWFEKHGGAEVVTSAIHRQIPHADLFTLWDDTDSGASESFLARTPLRGRKALALPLMPLAHRLYSGDYDLVISSSHAFAHTTKFRNDKRQTKYISYVHAPARYLWSPELDTRGSSPLLAPMRSILKRMDKNLGSHVSSLAVNSQEIANRVSKHWGMDSTVVYPPVDVTYFGDTSQVTDYERPFDGPYLVSVGRWISYKRVDLCIEVAASMNMPIAILGSGPEEEHLRATAQRTGAHVVFEVAPSRDRVRFVLQNAACMVFPAHEDFGIVPVEAMAAGCPVAGFSIGGLKETVQEGLSGHLGTELTSTGLIAAVRNSISLEKSLVSQCADKFSENAFGVEVLSWIRQTTA